MVFSCIIDPEREGIMARPRQPDQEPGPCEEKGCMNDTRYFPGGAEDRIHGLCRPCYNAYQQGRKSAAAVKRREEKLPSRIAQIRRWVLQMKDDGFLNATETDVQMRFWTQKWQSLIDKENTLAKNDRIMEQAEKQAERESWKHTDPDEKPN
jgi:hypothetical protein